MMRTVNMLRGTVGSKLRMTIVNCIVKNVLMKVYMICVRRKEKNVAKRFKAKKNLENQAKKMKNMCSMV